MPDQPTDEEASRDDAQLFADLFSGGLHLMATAGAVQIIRMQVGFLAVQVIRQRRPARVRTALLLFPDVGGNLFVVRGVVVRIGPGRLTVVASLVDEQLQLICFGGGYSGEKGILLVAVADLEPNEVQDLGDEIPELLKIKSKSDIPMAFHFQIAFGDGKVAPSPDAVAAINLILDNLKSGLKSE